MGGVSSHYKNTLALHAAVLLFGMAGLLGKAVSVTPMVVVFARAAIAALALAVWFLVRKLFAAADARAQTGTAHFPGLGAPNPRMLAGLAGSGILLAIHWTVFFQSIQVSSVAVGLLSFATFPVFMALMDPLFQSGHFRAMDLARACLVGVGLAIVVPEYDLRARVTQGAVWGFLSALTFALLAFFNRRFSQEMSPRLITAGQNAVAAVVLAPVILLRPPTLTPQDAVRLVVLGVVCTALAHALYVQGLRSVRLSTAGVVTALEPVYGMALAALLLGEWPHARSVIGGAIIVGVVMWKAAAPPVEPPARRSPVEMGP